eukprot:8006441-Pyramimonas_sp.AAC.1
MGSFGAKTQKPSELFTTLPRMHHASLKRSVQEARQRVGKVAQPLFATQRRLKPKTNSGSKGWAKQSAWIKGAVHIKGSQEYPREFCEVVGSIVSAQFSGAALGHEALAQ